jgi:hypothetical protein
MRNKEDVRFRRLEFNCISVLSACVMVCLWCLFSIATAAKTQSAAAAAPKAFETPQQAAEALITAAGAYDVPELMSIFGPDGEDFVSGGDQVQDKNNAITFATEARAKHSIAIEPSKPNRATIIVGEEEWPLPVPLIKKNGKWYFDAKAGRQDILFRRIGANELDAITVCHGYVEAQKEYAMDIHDNSDINQYAQKMFSTPGKHDGLYWKNSGRQFGRPDR